MWPSHGCAMQLLDQVGLAPLLTLASDQHRPRRRPPDRNSVYPKPTSTIGCYADADRADAVTAMAGAGADTTGSALVLLPPLVLPVPLEPSLLFILVRCCRSYFFHTSCRLPFT